MGYTVLVLTTSFPPDTNGRAQRLETRLKYLIREFDIDPVILVGGEESRKVGYTIEGKQFPVYRNPSTIEPETGEDTEFEVIDKLRTTVGSYLIPDLYIAYAPRIVIEATDIIKKHDVEILYTMCYPFSFHLSGLVLNRLCDVSWLVEFRDPWVTNPNHFDGEAGALNKWLEKLTINNADCVVYNYGIQVPDNYFKQNYPLAADKVIRIDCPGSTGFDFERIEGYSPTNNRSPNVFKMVYGGTFYGNGHSPMEFFKGLNLFFEENQVDKDQVSVDFYGDWEPEFDEYIEDHSLDEVINPQGWVSPDKFDKKLVESDTSLFIVRPFAGDELNVPQKVVNYVATRSPMLVLAQEDWEVASFTEEHNVGIVVDPNNPDEIAEGFCELFSAFKNDKLSQYTYTDSLKETIDAKTQAKEFATALDTSISNNRR